MSDGKTRSDSKLDALRSKQQDAVFEHCETVKLVDGVRWLKSEFDIEISINRLSKWLEKTRNDRQFAELLSDIRSDSERSELVAQALGDVGRLNESNIKMLSQALFAAQRTGNVKAVKNAVFGLSMVVEALAKDRTANANVISAETARDRFQFDAAKKALANAAELQDIQRSKGSEREKVERAVQRLFGKKPEAAKA